MAKSWEGSGDGLHLAFLRAMAIAGSMGLGCCLFLVAGASTGCGAEPPSLPLLEVSPPRLALGEIVCGHQKAQTVELHNAGGEALEVKMESTLREVTVEPSEATIAPGDTLTLQLVAELPRTTLPGAPLMGDLLIRSNSEDDRRKHIAVVIDPAGVAISMPRTSVDFGEVNAGLSVRRKLAFTVRGSGAATVTMGAPQGPFALVGPRTVELNASKEIELDMLAGSSNGARASTLPLTFSGELCGELPPSAVELSGLVTDAPITRTQTVVDLGEVGCESSTAELAMHSELTGALTYQTTFSNPLVALEEPQGGAWSRDPRFHFRTAMLSTLEAALGPFSTAASFAISNGSEVSVEVKGVVRRAKLATTEWIFFGEVAPRSQPQRVFAITNQGNAPAQVAAVAYSSSIISPSNFQLLPGASQQVTLWVTAPSRGGQEFTGGRSCGRRTSARS